MMQNVVEMLHILLDVDVEAGLRVVQEDALQGGPLDQVQLARGDHPVDRAVGRAGPTQEEAVNLYFEVPGCVGVEEEKKKEEDGQQGRQYVQDLCHRQIFST